MLVTERSAGRRLPNEADVSGRTLKHRFVDCMAACELSDVGMSLGSRTLGNSSWCPLKPSQLLAGSVGIRRRLFPLPHLSRETEKKGH